MRRTSKHHIAHSSCACPGRHDKNATVEFILHTFRDTLQLESELLPPPRSVVQRYQRTNKRQNSASRKALGSPLTTTHLQREEREKAQVEKAQNFSYYLVLPPFLSLLLGQFP
jgi:hypothetical protein